MIIACNCYQVVAKYHYYSKRCVSIDLFRNLASLANV